MFCVCLTGLCADPGTVSLESPMVRIIMRFIKAGVVISLVTAAGYPGEPFKYEQRLHGLLQVLAAQVEASFQC